MSVIPDFIEKGYDRGPFKLICDDLGPANMIVKSEEDLTIIGLVDLEWSHTRPAQLFASAPCWLLQVHLHIWDIDRDSNAPQILARFHKYLEIFKRVLREEEEMNKGKELSRLVEWSEASGAMWLHMVLAFNFNDYCLVPWAKLLPYIGEGKWEELSARFGGTEEAKDFVSRKVAELDLYDKELKKTETLKENMDNGKITKEEFIAGPLRTQKTPLLKD